jgi:antitoxin component of MazEF toxin-antitoxin module
MAIQNPKPQRRTLKLRGNNEAERFTEKRHLVESVYLLDELLARITPSNLHKEIDWGPAVGNELW